MCLIKIDILFPEAALFTRYSLLVRNLLVTQSKITRYSLYNLLVITSKPSRYHSKTYSLSLQNLLVIIQNLLVITSKPTRYNSKPTRYHFKTYSLSPQDLLVIIQKLSQNPPEVFCDKLANISRLRAAPLPIVSSPSNFLLNIRDIAFSPGGEGGTGKISTGVLVLFFVSLKFEKLLFFRVAQNDGIFRGLKK